MHPTVSTNPMHDGKAHEDGHRNERREALQMAIVQEPCGTQQHIKSDANPKPCIRCSRLITHGRCPSFQASSSILQLSLWPFWRLLPGRQLHSRSHGDHGVKTYHHSWIKFNGSSDVGLLYRLRAVALGPKRSDSARSGQCSTGMM